MHSINCRNARPRAPQRLRRRFGWLGGQVGGGKLCLLRVVYCKLPLLLAAAADVIVAIIADTGRSLLCQLLLFILLR